MTLLLLSAEQKNRMKFLFLSASQKPLGCQPSQIHQWIRKEMMEVGNPCRKSEWSCCFFQSSRSHWVANLRKCINEYEKRWWRLATLAAGSRRPGNNSLHLFKNWVEFLSFSPGLSERVANLYKSPMNTRRNCEGWQPLQMVACNSLPTLCMNE